MDNSTPPPQDRPDDEAAALVAAHRRRTRLPSFRASAALAVAMLTVGVGVGAAIGPSPATSLAGSGEVVQQLPALIASLAARGHTQAPAATAATPPPTIAPQATPAASAAAPTPASTPAAASTPSEPAAEPEPSSPAPRKTTTVASKPPPITSVWLIELSGFSFTEATANAAAAPYITGQLIPKGTLLSAWTSLSASAFAADSALVEHRATVGGTPPVLHTIVQPSCPEGAAGAACAPGTPAGVTAADQFVQAALTTITATTAYSEHGLVVVTYATVADPATAELPAGSASATLATTPAAGAVLLSPFAKPGARSSVVFNPTSPLRSLEALLH
jgi:S-DNA-T family DNA segregation ATPase FtsK/SpoIIIE